MSFKVSRYGNYEYETNKRVEWLDKFADEYEQRLSAVDIGRARNSQSLSDQISAIVSNSPRHATVDSVVKEMQERIGLKDYLKRISNSNENIKTASIDPELKKKIHDFIKYVIKQQNGFITLPAIQFEVKATFNKDVDDEILNSEEMLNDTNNLLTEYHRLNPSKYTSDQDNITETMYNSYDNKDTSNNNDYFSLLTPAKQ